MSYDRLSHKPPKPPPQLAIGELGNISHRHCRDVVWRHRMALVQGLHSHVHLSIIHLSPSKVTIQASFISRDAWSQYSGPDAWFDEQCDERATCVLLMC